MLKIVRAHAGYIITQVKSLSQKLKSAISPKKEHKDSIYGAQRSLHGHKNKTGQSSRGLKFRKRLDFDNYIQVAGYTSTTKQLHKKILIFAGYVTGFAFLGTVLYYWLTSGSFVGALVSSVAWLLLAAPVSYLGCWLMFYVITDFKIAGRREAIEKALPDFLQLAASNIRAGMSIDRALWLAIRPRFGILATEMELVAKNTMSGDRLEDALLVLSHKYDSQILQRTISLIIEGLRAGSEIGALLENVSLDINDMYQRRDNMAANVTQYLIFILFAVVVAAPLLFGMSVQLLGILNTIGGDLAAQQASSTSQTSVFKISISGESVNQTHFFIFCILSLVSTCIFSSLIVSNIKHGNGRDAVRLAPVIAVIALVLFLVAFWGLSILFSGLI